MTERPIVFADSRWLSAHIEFSAESIYDERADRVILDIVDPAINECRRAGLIDVFFFVRYGEHGPHIRLRVSGDPATLKSFVASSITQHVLARWPQAEVAAPASKPGSNDALTGARDGAVKRLAWLPYELEVDRYGGSRAMVLAQRVFDASSDAAISFLKETDENRASRLGKALLAMLLIIYVFLSSTRSARAFARYFEQAYLPSLALRHGIGPNEWSIAFRGGFERQEQSLTPSIREFWQRLDSRTSLPTDVERFRQRLSVCRNELMELWRQNDVQANGHPLIRWTDCVYRVVPSYVHMMLNRLGVTTVEEAYVAHLLEGALSASVVGR